MTISRHSATFTADGSGAAAVLLPSTAVASVSGRLSALLYTRSSLSSVAASSTLSVTATIQGTDEPVLSAVSIVSPSSTAALTPFYPRTPADSVAGASVAAFVPFVLAHDRVQVAVTGAGANRGGTLTAVFE